MSGTLVSGVSFRAFELDETFFALNDGSNPSAVLGLQERPLSLQGKGSRCGKNNLSENLDTTAFQLEILSQRQISISHRTPSWTVQRTAKALHRNPATLVSGGIDIF
jgi:hypothetical protein